MTPCWTLPHLPAAGALNLGRDEALLEWSATRPGLAAWRTYEWTPPTLSLGYFQTVAAATTDARFQDAPIVRRPSGGGAIWHDQDLTYALTLPDGHPLARRPGDLYEAVQDALASVLRAQGYAASRRGPAPSSVGKPFLCFADRDPQDVVVAGHKVAGAAQRRRAGAILQHGSLLLARSVQTPEFPGLAELAPHQQLSTRDWAECLRRAVLRALNLAEGPERGDRSTLEARAEQLAAEIYSSAGWTRRR